MRTESQDFYYVARAIDRWNDEYLTAVNDWFSTDLDEALEFEDLEEAQAEAVKFGGRVETYSRMVRVFGRSTDLGPSPYLEAAE